MKPRFLRASYFLWLAVPFSIYCFYAAFGLPHVISSYSWIDTGQGFDPFADRHYTECHFSGPYGNFTVYPRDGRCAWIKFYKAKAGAN